MTPEERATPVEHVFALKTVAPFSSLPPEDLALLVERATPRHYAAGESLLERGVPVGAVHLLLEGRVEEQRGGRPWTTRAPYELIGGVDAIAHAGEDLVAIAAEPTRTLELTREDLVDVCLDRFAVLATIASGVATMAIAARRRLGTEAGFTSVRPAAAARRERRLDLAERIVVLRETPALRDTRVRTVGEIARAMELQTIDAGTVLWRAGEPADRLLVVVAGAVRCTSEDPAHEFTLGPQDAIGVLDAVAGAPRWYGATAETAVAALSLPVDHLMDVLEDDPEAAVDALERFARATSTLVQRVAREAPARTPP